MSRYAPSAYFTTPKEMAAQMCRGRMSKQSARKFQHMTVWRTARSRELRLTGRTALRTTDAAPRILLSHSSKLYLSHSPTALKLSHLTPSFSSAISSITLALTPNFSNCPRFSGASLTSHAISLHAIAKTCLSSSHFLSRISVNFLGNSP